MPLNIPAGHGVASFYLRGFNDPDDYVTTLGVAAVGPGPLGESHAERLRTAFAGEILPLLSSDVSLVQVVLRVRQADGSDSVTTVTPTPAPAGGQASLGSAANVAVLLEKLTARGGKRGTGRMFLPGVPEDKVAQSGALVSTYVNDINTRGAAFLSRLQDPPAAGPPAQDPVVPVLFHNNASTTTRTVSGGTTTITRTTGAAGPGPTTITGFRGDPMAASQRRRLR